MIDIALKDGTTRRMGRLKLIWITAVPGLFMSFVTMYAGYLNVTDNYLPNGNYLLAVLSIVIMALTAIVFVTALKRSYGLLRTKKRVVDRHGDLVLDLVED